jgi:hypothetical protein
VKGPPVELRFHRVLSKSMERADGAIEKHHLFRGAVSIPSRYFDAPHARPREDALATAIVQRFAQAFPTEILALAVGEPISDPDAELPTQLTVPTIFIEHGPTWNGSVVATTNPRAVFVGLGISFTALFKLPDETKPVKMKQDVWKAPDTAAARDEAAAGSTPEEVVYGKMQDDAFAQFQKRLLGAFFKPTKGP